MHRTCVLMNMGYVVKLKPHILRSYRNSYTLTKVFIATFKKSWFVYVSECLHAYMYNTCVPGVCGGQKKALDFLELELQMVVSCHVAEGTEPLFQNRSSAKSNKRATSLVLPHFIKGKLEVTCLCLLSEYRTLLYVHRKEWF